MTPSNLKISLAEPDDAVEIAIIARRAFAKWVPILGREPIPMTMDYRAAILRREVWVVKADGQMAAFMKMSKIANSMFVDVLAVAPERQREQIGSAALRWAEATALRQRLDGVTLKTVAAYTDNILFYRVNGYTVRAQGEFNGTPILEFEKTSAVDIERLKDRFKASFGVALDDIHYY